MRQQDPTLAALATLAMVEPAFAYQTENAGAWITTSDKSWRCMKLLTSLCVAFLLLLSTHGASAQDGTDGTGNADVLQLGDIAVSGFAGVKLQVEGLPPGVDPVSKTVLDPDGTTLRVLDGSVVALPFSGQPLDLPLRKDFKATDIGHVFGLAFDTLPADERGTPGLYAGATSAFGLHVTGPDQDADGLPDRLTAGAPDAVFMQGLFGLAPQGGAGAVWKIESATGLARLYAELANSGPGIGGLAFDPVSRSLYASDLDSGLIHQFQGLDIGADIGQFDHGLLGRPLAAKPSVLDDGQQLTITSPAFETANPATWGYTSTERRIDALAVYAGRLYYAAADGPEIWSVGLAPDGSFAGDARIEVPVTLSQPGQVTAIAFDPQGRMVIAVRNAVQNTGNYAALVAAGPTDVVRFTPETPDDPETASTWLVDTETYPVGHSPERRDSSGGVALQYALNPDGSLNTAICGGTVMATGDALGQLLLQHGLQIGGADQFQVAPAQPIPADFVALDPAQDSSEARGHAGGVAVLQRCESLAVVAKAEPGFPTVVDEGGSVTAPEPGTLLPGVEDEVTVVFPGVEKDEVDEDGKGGKGGKKGKLTLAKTATVPVCNPKGGCAFNIEVRNDGAAVKGPIVINELIEAPQAALTGEPNAPWQCSKVAPFVCTHPGPVPANGKLDMRVVFAPNLPQDARELRNCAALATEDKAPVCATITLDPKAPVQPGPIIVAKKGASKCTANGPCTFSIAVQNITDAVVNGPIVIDEQIDAPNAIVAGEPNAPWTCNKTAPFACTHPGPLPPKSSVDLTLSFTPNVAAGTKQLKNCAVVIKPANAPQKKASLVPNLLPVPEQKALRASHELPRSTGLLHLAANHGSIGGPGVSNKCLRWETTNRGFVIRQANGFQVSFSDMVIEGNVIKGGNATYIVGAGPVGGKIMPGEIISGVDYSFRVEWNNGIVGHYRVFIDGQGTVTGFTQEGGDLAAVDLTGDSKWWKCAVNDICDKYAKEAAGVAKKFNQLSCGPDVPPGRWSKDVNSHLAWCMGQPVNSTFIQSETEDRRKGLAQCEADRGKFCDGFVANMQTLGKQFTDLNCTEAPAGFLVGTADRQRSFCVSQSRQILAALDRKAIELLTACKARLAKTDEAAKVGEVVGGTGGKIFPPAPEQCAVVDIEDNKTGPVVVGKGKVDPATRQGQLAVLKEAVPGSCKSNQSCGFRITVENQSDTRFDGPVRVFDDLGGIQLNGGGQLFATATVTAQAPWRCAREGQRFKCDADKITLPPKARTSFTAIADFGVAAIGLKEMKNCANLEGSQVASCASHPFAQVLPPPPPPPPPSKLVLAKNPAVEQCSDIGGGCAFTISITNPGPEEFVGPLEFTDNPTTADGRPLPGVEIDGGGQAIQQAGVTAPVFCKKSGAGFVCSTGIVAARIPARKTVVVPISLKPGAAGAATAIRNCAALTGGEAQCRTIPLIQGPLLRAEKFDVSAVKTCVPNCTFVINLKNVGTTNAIGPFVITEKFTPTPLSIRTLSGDLACNGVAGKFSCISTNNKTNVLKPGETITSTLQMINLTRAPEYTNCVEYDPQANAQPVPFDTTFPGRCATVKETTPPPPRMVIKKEPIGPCHIASICTFGITLTNQGEGPFKGPVRVIDTVTSAGSGGAFQTLPEAIAASGSPDWMCDIGATDRLNCMWRRGTRIEPGQKLTLNVIVKPGKTWKKNDTMKNCAVLFPTDGQTGGESCVNIKLDPFAVKVTKSGDQACELGQDCNFKISLFNPGPIDHIAPVTITDQLTGLPSAQIVSITSANPADPFPCNPAPTQVPFTCTSPGDYPLLLGPSGELQPAKEFNMVVRLPNDATAGQFSNCAAASDGSGDATEQSCVTVTTTPPLRLKPVAKEAVSASCGESAPCDFKVTITNTLGRDMPGPIVVYDLTTVGGVPSTQMALASGPAAPWVCIASAAPGMQCSHPGPLAMKASLELTLGLQPLPGSLGTATVIENCATLEGIRPGFGTACASIPVKATAPPPKCFGGMVLADGICACPANLEWNGTKCICKTCGINTSRQPTYKDSLPPDCDMVMYSLTGACSAAIADTKKKPPKIQQPKPLTLITPPAAKCKTGFERNSKGDCVCPAGTRLSKGKCLVPQVQPAKCKTGFVRSSSGQCVCPAGKQLSKGKCITPQPVRVKCSKNQILDEATNTCVRRKQSVCPTDRPVGKYPNCCPEGTAFSKGKCRPPRVEAEKFCEGDRPNGVYPNCCPDGYQYTRGKCRRNQETKPAEPVEPLNRDCGEGYRQLDKPNKYGAYCEQIPVAGPEPDPTPPPPPPPKCPKGKVGEPPNCQCPSNKDEGEDGKCYDKTF